MLNKTDGIKIKGYRGTWYVIDSLKRNGKTYYLLESEIWGDEAPNLTISDTGLVIADDTYDPLEIVLDDNDIYDEGGEN